MRKLLIFISLSVVLFSCNKSNKSPRSTEKFNTAWKFALLDTIIVANSDYNDSAWRVLDLPHDWSIEGKFDPKHPADVGGGALPGGIGWYRKQFALPKEDEGKVISIMFDGVYMNSSVYVNGTLVGTRPYGYISFVYDISSLLKFDNTPNTIAVRVDNSLQPNCRWYSGSGIYRNVWLTKTEKVHIANWGTYVTTPQVSADEATVKIETTIENKTTQKQTVELVADVYNSKSKKVETNSITFEIDANSNSVQVQNIQLKKPDLWGLKNPVLYNVVSQVKINDKLTDSYKTDFGIRSFEFDADKGFILNGEAIKIVGVCNHHDLGALGAAVNYRAIERQLEIMKEMGMNGIRTSHNPPAPELLDLCDKMGFIVMDETFDVWAKKKWGPDYSIHFDKWHEQDITDHILRDRNHPSIFIWSIGNEIVEQWDTTGTTIANKLCRHSAQARPYPTNYFGM
jgi:beta-galactosidase